MNKDIEINGNMNLGAYSPLELDEEQQLNELSNQLLANYMKKAKSQDRERQFDVAKNHAVDTINEKLQFKVRDYTWPDRAYFMFSIDYQERQGFIIEVYYFDTVDTRNNYLVYLTPENPLYDIEGHYYGSDNTQLGFIIKNMRAGERMKFKQLCQAANELNGNGEEELNEVDRHRPGYYADYAKRTGKKDRHKKGYYKKYNKEHPERLNRGYTKGYKGGYIDNGPIGGKQDNEIIGYDMLGRPITKDPFLDKLRNKTEFEWYDEDWDEGGYKDVHESVTKQNNLRSMIREGLAELAGEQFTHQLGPDGDVVYGKDEQGFFVYTKNNLGIKYFNTVEEADEYARKLYKAIRLRKNAERQEFDRQMSLDETAQKHLVDVMKRYTEGNATAEEANKAIMDLANSSVKDKKINESNMEEDTHTVGILIGDVQDKNDLIQNIILELQNKGFDLDGDSWEMFDDRDAYVPFKTLKNNNEILKLFNYFGSHLVVDNSTWSNIKLLQNYLSKNSVLNESYAKDGNYTHFAVHKTANKIVNGWDYHGYDPEELRMYKKDYFIQDLIDYELDPKQYTILTLKGCKARGIDPFDDSQWANGYELDETSGKGNNPYYGERHDMENKKIENLGNMKWGNFKK